MGVKKCGGVSLKRKSETEIILLLSLKTFDATARFRLHPSQVQGFLKEQLLKESRQVP